MQFVHRTKKLSIEEGAEIFDQVKKIFEQNQQKITNFHEWSELDEQVRKLEEAKQDFESAKIDFTEKKEQKLTDLQEFEEKRGSFKVQKCFLCLILRIFVLGLCQELQENLHQHRKILNEHMKEVLKSTHTFGNSKFNMNFFLRVNS